MSVWFPKRGLQKSEANVLKRIQTLIHYYDNVKITFVM